MPIVPTHCGPLRLCVAAAALLTASHAPAQSLETAPVTVTYAQLGPVTWSPVAGIRAMLASPRITAGPRVLCTGTTYRCDVAISARPLRYFARPTSDLVEEVKEQFQSIASPPPRGSLFQTVATPQSVELTYFNERAEPGSRYTTIALVMKGPALLAVFAQASDEATIAAMLNIARTVKLGTPREVFADRFAQIVAVCSSRVPSTQVANERALAASPFNDNATVALLRLSDTTMTLEKMRASRSRSLQAYLKEYDSIDPMSRASFCTELPKTISAAARELRTM